MKIRVRFIVQHIEPLFPNNYEPEEQTFNRISPVSVVSWKGYWSLFLFNAIHIQVIL